MPNIKVLLLLFICFLTISTAVCQTIPKAYSSYRPSPSCNPAKYFEYPTTTEEVQKIVQHAIANSLTVKAVGARHSQSDIICTEGIPIDANGLKYYNINSDGTATIGAGVMLHDATAFLRQNNRGLRTTPGYGNITIGGTIGTGAHGSTIKYTSSISEQVVGLEIVDGLGNIQNITDPEDLHAFRIHLGLLGIVCKVTLVTVPLYKTLAHNYVVSDTVLTDGTAQQWALNADQMSLYWFPSVSQVVVANWSIVDVSTPGNAVTSDHVPSTTDSLNILGKNSLEILAILTQNSCEIIKNQAFNLLNILQAYMKSTLFFPTLDFVPIYAQNGVFQNPAVGYYDLMFAPTCVDGPNGSPLQCLWSHGNVNANITILDNEISVALSQMPQFIADIKDILSKAPALFVIQGILMRFSAKSATYMSTAYGRDSVAIEFYTVHRDNYYEDASASLAAYQTIMQTLTKKYGGRSHWGKSGPVYHSQKMIDLKMDPTARQKFIVAMKKFDPNQVFINNFGKRLKGISEAQDIDPKAAVHCALLDNCFCSKSTDCASSYQTCTTLPGYNDYNVCQTNGEKPVAFLPVLSSQTTISYIEDAINSLLDTVQHLTSVLECVLQVLPALGVGG